MMFGMGLGLLLIVLFLGLLSVGAVLLARGIFSGGGQNKRPAAQGADPRQVLDQRYAHGEITRDEYEQIRADLAP